MNVKSIGNFSFAGVHPHREQEAEKHTASTLKEQFVSYVSKKNQVKKVADFLLDNNLKLSVAESCTGGLISSQLTDIPGASDYISLNLVTYANEAKIKMLGVKKESIDKYDVVSDVVAKEMADGLVKKYDADVAISTTGITGPTGGSSKKPVGLVYIGFATKDTVEANRYVSPKSGRVDIKQDIVKKVFELFYDFLLKNFDKTLKR